jgi:hypothetical protein
MELSLDPPEKRAYIFFFLILLAAILWATFLLYTGQMLAVSAAIVLIAAFISIFSFVFYRSTRTWIFFWV